MKNDFDRCPICRKYTSRARLFVRDFFEDVIYVCPSHGIICERFEPVDPFEEVAQFAEVSY